MTKKTPTDRQRQNAGTFQPGNRAHARENMPKGRFITRQLILQLNEEMDEDVDPTDKSRIRKRAKVVYFLCKKLIRCALDGDITAIKLIMDRIEGTPISTVMFKDIPDGAETPEQMTAIRAAQDEIKDKSEAELRELYRQAVESRASLTSGSRTSGSA